MLRGFLFLVVSPAETSERYFQFCFPISPPLRSGAQVVQCCKYLHAAGSNPVLWKDLVFSQVSATSEETTFLFIFIKKKVLRVFLHLDLYRTFWQCVVSERYQKLVLAPVDQSFEARSQNWISRRPMDSAKCNLNRFAGFRSEVIFRSHTRADLY